MKADGHQVNQLFGHEKRFVVPLFQRPYVWKRDEQWEPLINDILSLAEHRIGRGGAPRPHFLGAIVMDLLPTPTAVVPASQIIDGQQRLVTLQLLLAACRDLARAAEAAAYVQNFGQLTYHDNPLIKVADEKFKVWPTNVDRNAFRSIMTAGSRDEVNLRFPGGHHKHDELPLLAQAYAFFSDRLKEWYDSKVASGLASDAVLESLRRVFTDDLIIVVIDLGKDDDAQGIFETLNARGTPLLPGDLIKNFLLRQIEAGGDDVENLYERYWQDFDRGFWRGAIKQGRLKRQRFDLFLQHYLTLKTKDEVRTDRLFAAFRTYRSGASGAAPSAPVEEIKGLSAYAAALTLARIDPGLLARS